MDNLTQMFGYRNALIIKDVVSALSNVILGMFLLIWFHSSFILNTFKSKHLDSEIAITKAEFEGREGMLMNPKTKGEAIRVQLGGFLLMLSPNKSIEFRTRTLKHLSRIVGTIMFFLFILGLLLSYWHYLPDGIGEGVNRYQ